MKAARRNDRKQSRASALRKQMRVHGLIAAAKFYLSLKGNAEAPPPLHLDCDACLKLQKDVA